MDTSENVFDLDRYLRVSGATKRDYFDWIAAQPRLDDEALFALAYMTDIESHTIVYLRDLLGTRVVLENEVTAFLSCWAYEEFFHSLLLRRFLATQGMRIEDERFKELRSWTSAADRFIRPAIAVLSRLKRHFPAVHMTFGAINEISTLNGYQALISRTETAREVALEQPSLLTTILLRIIKDERRHFAFYFSQARSRLRAPTARRLVATPRWRASAPICLQGGKESNGSRRWTRPLRDSLDWIGSTSERNTRATCRTLADSLTRRCSRFKFDRAESLRVAEVLLINEETHCDARRIEAWASPRRSAAD